jgi:HAD superfamily hydrolase (TIGR01509 family)
MRPMRKPLKVVLFDLDGTLLDSQRVDMLAMTRLFNDELGLDFKEEQISSYIGIASRDVLDELAPDRVEELLAVWFSYQHELLSQTRLFPGIRQVLRSLSQSKLVLGVVTGQNRGELNATRQHIAIEDFIDVWVCADDTSLSKPHPDPVHLALDLLGYPPDQAIMIGDTLFDMQAGRQAGTRLGATLWGARDIASLLSYDPEYTFAHPAQLEHLCSLIG